MKGPQRNVSWGVNIRNLEGISEIHSYISVGMSSERKAGSVLGTTLLQKDRETKQ